MPTNLSCLPVSNIAMESRPALHRPMQVKEQIINPLRLALSRWMPAACLAIGLLGGATASAATWATPGSSGTWNTPANWNPAVAPQNVDVVIDGQTGLNSTVSLDVNATVNNLTVSSGDVLTVNVIGPVLTIDGSTTPVIVNNQGTIRLDGGSAAPYGGKGLSIKGTVGWQGNGLSVVGNANSTQFRILAGAQLTVPIGTTFDFTNQSWCDGVLVNHGTFKIGGLFLGGSAGSSQINDGTMEFRGRVEFKVTNYVGATLGHLTLRSASLEQGSSVDGGYIHFAGGNFDLHRSGFGNALTLNGTNITNLESSRTIDMIRSSTFNLDAAGSYDFDGLITMDVMDPGTNSGRYTSNATISANNGMVGLNGDGSISMTVGVLGTHLRHSILTGAAATDGFVNNLAGGISGAGKIGNNAISLVNHTLIDATDATYAIELDPVASGSFVNSATGTLRASGAGGLVLRAGSYSNAGAIVGLAGSTVTLDSGATLDSTGLIDIAGALEVDGLLDLTLTDGLGEGLVIGSPAAGAFSVDAGTGGIHVIFAQDFAPGTAYPTLLAISMAGDHAGYLQGLLDSGLLTYDASAISPQYLGDLQVLYLGGTTVFGFIPEPASGLLLALAGLFACHRRRNR